jgi:hypothetical protein
MELTSTIAEDEEERRRRRRRRRAELTKSCRGGGMETLLKVPATTLTKAPPSSETEVIADTSLACEIVGKTRLLGLGASCCCFRECILDSIYN